MNMNELDNVTKELELSIYILRNVDYDEVIADRINKEILGKIQRHASLIQVYIGLLHKKQ